jgi:hypothetical protein
MQNVGSSKVDTTYQSTNTVSITVFEQEHSSFQSLQLSLLEQFNQSC